MSNQEFAKLLPTRERRSLTRGFTDSQKILIKKIEAANNGTRKKSIKTHCRSMIILPNMVGLMIHVHRGNKFDAIQIVPEMIGHRFGEFAETRVRLKHSAPGIGATRSSAYASVK